jgi:hypothetical protein
MYNNILTNCWMTFGVTLNCGVTLGHSSRRLLVGCDTLSNYLEKLRMVLNTKHITERCPQLKFKIHWTRTTFARRRTADLYNHMDETVLHEWSPSCGPRANFNLRHLTMYNLDALIPCDSNEHQPHRNLESINRISLSNSKLWNFYGVTQANILRQTIAWILCNCLQMKLRTSP